MKPAADLFRPASRGGGACDFTLSTVSPGSRSRRARAVETRPARSLVVELTGRPIGLSPANAFTRVYLHLQLGRHGTSFRGRPEGSGAEIEADYEPAL